MCHDGQNCELCGGSLITSKTVLTAAHCTYNYSASDMTLWVGEHNWNDDSDGQQEVAVLEKIEHPDYNYDDNSADFALLVLSEPVTWRREVQPVCLPGLEAGSYENIKVLIYFNMFTIGITVKPIISNTTKYSYD